MLVKRISCYYCTAMAGLLYCHGGILTPAQWWELKEWVFQIPLQYSWMEKVGRIAWGEPYWRQSNAGLHPKASSNLPLIMILILLCVKEHIPFFSPRSPTEQSNCMGLNASCMRKGEKFVCSLAIVLCFINPLCLPGLGDLFSLLLNEKCQNALLFSHSEEESLIILLQVWRWLGWLAPTDTPSHAFAWSSPGLS